MQKNCNRCKSLFQCKVLDIKNCDCTVLNLTALQRKFLAERFEECVCLNCLIEISKMNKKTFEKINKSETRIFKAVFPNTTNHYDTLFGGTALQLMDEAAFICATRFSRKKVVTVSSDKVDFNTPIPGGTLIELIARIEEVGTKSVKVSVEIFIEQMYSDCRESAIKGTFTMVAVDENKKAIPIL